MTVEEYMILLTIVLSVVGLIFFFIGLKLEKKHKNI